MPPKDQRRPRRRGRRQSAEPCEHKPKEANSPEPKGTGSHTVSATATQSSEVELGTRLYFTCPVCGDGNADATYKLDQYGYPKWFVGCKSLSCEELGGEYLRLLAECVREPDSDMPNGAALLHDPLRWLGSLTAVHRRSSFAEPVDLPTYGEIADYHRRLMTEDGAFWFPWLRDERGIAAPVISELRLGVDDRGRLVVPMFRNRELVALKTLLRPGEKLRWPPGCSKDNWPLHPEPEFREGWTLLVEGEWDALCARSFGLPATSVTGGISNWRDEWADDLAGLRVIVLFDVGAHKWARRRAAELRSAGVSARALSLRRLGMGAKGADLSDYLLAGNSVKARRKAAGRLRRAARAD